MPARYRGRRRSPERHVFCEKRCAPPPPTRKPPIAAIRQRRASNSASDTSAASSGSDRHARALRRRRVRQRVDCWKATSNQDLFLKLPPDNWRLSKQRQSGRTRCPPPAFTWWICRSRCSAGRAVASGRWLATLGSEFGNGRYAGRYIGFRKRRHRPARRGAGRRRSSGRLALLGSKDG